MAGHAPKLRPREEAVRILGLVDEGAHADALLASHTTQDPDARLLREIVLGTLTWRGRLDHHLDTYLKRPIDRQKRPVRDLLRSGAYQILFLDRVPAYAKGQVGVIERVCSLEFAQPEEVAYGKAGASYRPVYRVRLRQRDLWPDYAGAVHDTLDLEIFENWLEQESDNG